MFFSVDLGKADIDPEHTFEPHEYDAIARAVGVTRVRGMCV